MAPSNLPSDVTIEILSRLPVKTLSRFKCVSKTFHNLISNDPVFRKKHLHHQSRSKKVILVPQFKSPGTSFSCPLFSLSPDDGDFRDEMVDLILPVRVRDYYTRKVKFHNSCDGLFCISMIPGRDVIIWNPTTRSVRRFQGCHPRHRTAYSLAYDSRSDVYKLLGISVQGNNNYSTYGLCFYSSQTGMWRRIEDYSCDYVVKYDGNPTIVNGAFHWLGSTSDQPNFQTPHVIVSLDVSDETFCTFALPQAMCATCSNDEQTTLYELKGKLCVFIQNESELCCDLWVMDVYGDVDSMTRVFRLTCFEMSDLIFRPLFLLDDSRVVIYRQGNASVGGMMDGKFAYVYFESLVSPHTRLGV